MSREVMQQALDALTDCWTEYYQHTSPRTGQWVLDAIETIRAELAKPAPVVVPEGWQLVRQEPTEEMTIAGFESEPDEHFSPELWEQMQEMSGCEQAAFKARLSWKAMLLANPEPPVQTVDVEALREVIAECKGIAIDRYDDDSGELAGDWAERLARAIGDET